MGSVSATEDTINNTSTSIGDNTVDVSSVDQNVGVEVNLQTNDSNLSDDNHNYLNLTYNSEDNADKITVNHNISHANDLECTLNAGGNYLHNCVNASLNSSNASYGTVVNSTFFNYFDDTGVLRNNITCDYLIFEGNFNLNVSTITIN